MNKEAQLKARIGWRLYQALREQDKQERELLVWIAKHPKDAAANDMLRGVREEIAALEEELKYLHTGEI